MTQEMKNRIAAEILKLIEIGIGRFSAVDSVLEKYREAWRCSPDIEQNPDRK